MATAGGLHDRDTGLVRFGTRDYDPETGRWTAKDPILFKAETTNLYQYGLSDPINFHDVNGLWSVSVDAYAGVGGGSRNLRGGVGAAAQVSGGRQTTTTIVLTPSIF